MATFEIAFDWMMRNEDGSPPYRYKLVTDNNGAGVISGINEASYPDHFAAIAAMPQANRGPAVQAFYEAEFWNQWLEQLDQDDLAKRVFDAAVNMGPVTAVKLLQEAAASPVDGVWGPHTVDACNNEGFAIVEAFRQVRAAHYQDIVAAHPENAIYWRHADGTPGPWQVRALA